MHLVLKHDPTRKLQNKWKCVEDMCSSVLVDGEFTALSLINGYISLYVYYVCTAVSMYNMYNVCITYK